VLAMATPLRGMAADTGMELEEIVITARKREENIQKTPVAVTAFTEEALANRSVQSVDQVAQYTPNLQFDGSAALSGGRFNSTMFIRGVGQNDFATFSDAGVGLYIDGIYMGRTIGGIMDAVDMSRVEVLRGPQGTLFGRNTIGGAVNIVTQAPTTTNEFRADATTGEFHRTDFKGMVNLSSAGGEFRTRITAASMKRAGYAKQIDYITGDTSPRGDHNAQVARIQAVWEPSDTFSANFNADGTWAKEHAAPLTLLRVASATGNAAGYPFFNLYNNLVAPNQSIVAPNGLKQMNSSWITGNPYTTYGNFYNLNELENWGTGLTLRWKLGDMEVKSITGYRHLHAKFGRDGDNTPLTFRETYNDDTAKQLSEELQFSGSSFNEKLNWLAGLYYFKEDSIDDGGARLAAGVFNALEAQPTGSWSPPALAPRPTACNPALPGPPCLGGAGNPQNVSNDLQIHLYNVNASKSYAFFAQATYKITDKFSITPGVRYTRDQKEFSGYQLRLNANQYIIPPGFMLDKSWSQVNPKLSLEFQAKDNVLLYVSGSSGYKAGGFNERPLRNVGEVNIYDPEKIFTYEAGIKTSLFNRRMTWNTAVFHSKYQNIQLTVNATPLNFVFNAAEGKMQGVESEMTVRLAPGLDLNLSGGYLDAKYTSIDASKCPSLAACPITTNSKFVKAPKWTASGGLQYVASAGQNGDITLRGDWSYKSKIYNDVGNDEAIAQAGYSLFNARIAWKSSDEQYSAAFFVTNLGDKLYKVSGNASSAAFGSLAEATYAPPREWGLTVGLRFK
jgi:iron complex outermembrane receptor protein